MMNHGFYMKFFAFYLTFLVLYINFFFLYTNPPPLTISPPKHPDAQPQTRFSQAKSHKTDLERNQLTQHPDRTLGLDAAQTKKAASMAAFYGYG